jgi:uncharacterized OsmC-like protein
MKENPEIGKITFVVSSEWNGGFSVTSRSKELRVGNTSTPRSREYETIFDFPEQFSGQGQGPTVCENCMGSLAACLTQTIVAHATSMGIKLDSIKMTVAGDVDLHGFSGLSKDIRPGAKEFRVQIDIKSYTASKEQIQELHQIAKKFSPAFDTLTHGTSVVLLTST